MPFLRVFAGRGLAVALGRGKGALDGGVMDEEAILVGAASVGACLAGWRWEDAAVGYWGALMVERSSASAVPGARASARPRWSRARIVLAVAGGAALAGALALVAFIAWGMATPVEFDERAGQVVAPGKGEGTAIVEVGPHLGPEDAGTLDERVEMPLAVCRQGELRGVAEGDRGGVGLIAAGTTRPGEDRRVTLELAGDGPGRAMWKLAASWDGQTHRDDLAGVTVELDAQGDGLVRTAEGARLAVLRCHG